MTARYAPKTDGGFSAKPISPTAAATTPHTGTGARRRHARTPVAATMSRRTHDGVDVGIWTWASAVRTAAIPASTARASAASPRRRASTVAADCMI